MCAGVKRLQKLGMIHSAPGMGALDMNSAEDMVVAHTREVVPGMVICGMEVCSYALSVFPCAPLPSNCHRCKLHMLLQSEGRAAARPLRPASSCVQIIRSRC